MTYNEKCGAKNEGRRSENKRERERKREEEKTQYVSR